MARRVLDSKISKVPVQTARSWVHKKQPLGHRVAHPRHKPVSFLNQKNILSISFIEHFIQFYIEVQKSALSFYRPGSGKFVNTEAKNKNSC